MLDRVKLAGQRLVAGFRGFTIGQKAVTIVAVLVLAVGGYFFSTWASQPSYAPLFSNLASADASAIVDKLDAAGVKYQLSDGGATILVPKDKVYALRLTMSGAGLPAGDETSGYPLLDKQGMTTSEFMQHVTYQRALEGELAKTIKSIDGVQAAIVHLALPTKDVFADDTQKPTASVLVKTKAGDDLDKNQIEAITNLVASSVEGLDTENVTLADADGKVLSSGDGTGADAGSDDQVSATAAFEKRMADSLQKMLNQVVGQGHANVTVNAVLDFDKTESKSQSYTSDPSTAPLADSTKIEKYTGGGGTTSTGVLGPDNIQVPAGVTGTAGAYENSATTRNNAVNSVIETRTAAPGAIKRLNVAVLLDAKTASAISTAKVQSLIQAGAGIDATRGDTMAITALPFDQTAAAAAQKELLSSQKDDAAAQTMSLIKTGIAAGVILLLVLFAAIAGRRNRKKQARTMLTPSERLRLEEAQDALERERVRAIDGGGSGIPALTAGDGSPGSDLIAQRNDISDLVDRQPEEVAQLLRGWLADRRETADV
jgi:flagellar M-ring protein FliF